MKKSMKSLLGAGVMVVLSFGVIFGTRMLTTEDEIKMESIDCSAFAGTDATVVEANRILGDADETAGYMITVSSVGFNEAAPVQMNVTFDADKATVTSLEIVEQSETDGLGSKITEDTFLAQFENIEAPVYTADLAANGTAFDQVTGASFSSKAVANGVNTAFEFVSTLAE